MKFKSQTGHWRFAAARFPDAVHFRFDPTYLATDDYNRIYLLEAMAVEMIVAAQCAGATTAILVHGNPSLPPGTISLRTIVRDIMRDECATLYLRSVECIECDEAFIAVLHRRIHGNGAAS